jgi:hypothetical protein
MRPGDYPNEEYKNCVCGGSNENCHWCSGSGFVKKTVSLPAIVADELAKILDSSKIRPLLSGRKSYGPASTQTVRAGRVGRMQFPPPVSPVFRCPFCKVKGDFATLKIHLSEAHPQDMKLHMATAPRKRSPQKEAKYTKRFTFCPFCRARIRGTRLNNHLRKVHPESRAAHSYRKPKSLAKVLTADMVDCPHCSAVMRSYHLPRHLRKAHHSGAVRTQAAREPDTSKSARTAPIDTGPIARDQTRVERRLDATKDYAHAFREQGRFGSHPSHDDFSHEGKA